ncbi:MAG: ABC transporter permease [Gammaproteobacteria bacterium]
MEPWRRNKLAFFVLTLPPSAWLLVFFAVPLAIIWLYSFADRGPQGQVILAFSLENYQRAIEWIHLGIIWKSIGTAAICTAISFLIGFPIAVGIAFAKPRYKNILLLLVILPFWTNLLIRTYAWIAVLRTRGFLNFGLEWAHEKITAVLTVFGLPQVLGAFQPLELLYNQKAVVIGLVYVYLPFLVLPVYATLEKLDKSYLEASLDLGAGHLRTLRSIMIPLTLPGILSGCFLVFILSLGTFLTPDLLGGTNSEMIGNLIARQFSSSRDWPFGAALSFLLLYATFLILWFRAMYADRSQGAGVT